MTPDEIQARLVHALTAYDSKQSTRKGHNPYALGIYFQRVDEIIADIKAGADVRAAICAGFSDRVLDVVLKALSLPLASKSESSGAWEYKPASQK